MTSDELLYAAHEAINEVMRGTANSTTKADHLRRLKDNIDSWLKHMGYSGCGCAR